MRAPKFILAALAAYFALALAPPAIAVDEDALDRVRKFAIGSAAAEAAARSRSNAAAASAARSAAAAQNETGQEAAGIAGEADARRDVERAERRARPFGWNLFNGQFATNTANGLNPGYLIAPGDRVQVNLFGAKAYNEVTVVDAQGNLFVPEVGPIRVAGVSNSRLQSTVQAKVSRVFTDNVQVYVNLLGAQPTGVFVTGAVMRPGRYGGLPNDSLLSFIDKAGGIDVRSGSFRDVRILRAGQEIERADLYEFLVRGQLPTPQFREGDTILIGPIGGSVTVDGAVRAPAALEFQRFPVLGQELVSYARPTSDATHVALSGIRGGQPFNTYMSYSQFLQTSLGDGDLVTFQADLRAGKVFVEVDGAHLGASRFAVPRGARIEDVLDLVEVNPDVAATQSVYLRRDSVARDQKRALDRSLDALERSALAALNQTTSQADIREREARLVLDFIKRARDVQPDGRVVISTDAGRANVMLEAGDVIIVPQRTDLVLISGEVTLPQSVAHISGASVEDYVARAGGYAERADPEKIIIIRASGEALNGPGVQVRPGDQIMVLPVVDVKSFEIGKDVLDVLFRVAIIAATVIAL